MVDYLQVTTAACSREEADRIAGALVERRLTGCVQVIGPMHSVYRWQGRIEQAEEWLCVIKTTRPQYGDVEAAIRELHSYECPEIIATPIEAGSESYLAWLAEQSQGGG
jgi:periplasmic divalent cation tolerance protein